MRKERVTICIDRSLLKEIDKRRGLASRSAYIESILEKALEMKLDKAIAP